MSTHHSPFSPPRALLPPLRCTACLNGHPEIAFYKGNKKEEQVLKSVFQRLVGVTRRSERFRHSMGVLDSVIAKYFATIVGWTVVSRPFLNPEHPRHATSTPAEVYQGEVCLLVTAFVYSLFQVPRWSYVDENEEITRDNG